jgi:polysaccharide export outer membrane protein
MRRSSVLLLAGWLATSPLLLSCASSPPVQHTTVSTATSTPTATATQAQAKTTTSPDYIIGPGDVLQVFVWRNPELSVTVPVRPDGKISSPLVENMVAVGKTAPQLSRDMEGVLSEYVRQPKVNIIVTNAASASSLVKVVGQVAHPQAVPYRDGMTVLDAILAVGGLTQFASGNRSHIVRLENGHETTIKVKVADLVNNGDVSQNLPLKPGDLLVVPQSMF